MDSDADSLQFYIEKLRSSREERMEGLDSITRWVLYKHEKLEERFDCFEPGKYGYSAIWGNGMEAPKGESDDDDISFSIEIERGSKTFQIRVAEW